MLELINIDLRKEKLPETWFLEQGKPEYGADGLNTGRCVRTRFLLPGTRWKALQIEVEAMPLPGATICCGDGTLTMTTDLVKGQHRILNYGKSRLAATSTPVAKTAGGHRIMFECVTGRWRVLVDGREVVAADDPRPQPVGGLFSLEFWDQCLVHNLCIRGDDPVPAPPLVPAGPRSREPFHLEITVDFFDDLMHAPFTKTMFDRLFTVFADWGVSRCHWIYYGGSRHGFWASSPYNVDRHAAETMAEAGEILPAAVAAAHAHGIELYGLIKPFDMGFTCSCGENTPAARAKGRLPRIGGPVTWVADFPAHHPEYAMARKPDAAGTALNDTITRIDLVKEDDGDCAFSVHDLEVYVSDDNAGYRRYAGPAVRLETVENYPRSKHSSAGRKPGTDTRRARVIRLDKLEIREKYVALAVASRNGSFANDLINLLRVYGPQGEEPRLTYGTWARRGREKPEGAQLARKTTDFTSFGIEFDAVPGTPTAVFPNYDAVSDRHVFDGGDGFLAFARGKDQGTLAALSPAFPEVRAWWLEWVGDVLDAGADGVELRVRNHHTPFAWSEFGFEPPVREAFRQRYGVDLWATDDFDREAWRRLRGEYYTQFYRAAAALVRSRGKRLGLHISSTMNMEPNQGAAMDIHWDWRTWLTEGLADSVTMKEVWPLTRFAAEILALTRQQAIPVVFAPYANNIWGDGEGVRICAERIRLARDGGYDGFQFYECCAVVRAARDGGITLEQPGLRELFRREFRRT